MVLTDIDTDGAKDLPDDYVRLVDLIGIPFVRGRIVDATMRILTATAEVIYSDFQPATTDTGDQVGAGSGYGSPWYWRIERIWLREFSAGGGAKVVFAGTVNVE